LQPARWVLQALGIPPTDMQAWALMVALFMFCLAAPGSYGDWMLSRRSRRVTGSVLSIDTGGDTDTARIGFRDHAGQSHAFDSNLPTNGTTGTIGNAVEVIYDPLYPKRAREAGRSLAKLLTYGGWYAGALLVLAYALWGGGLPVGD
jgi:hypothetical protein